MKSSELLARAQELHDRAQFLEQRANALRQAESMRSQAAQLVAQAMQIESAFADDSEQAQSRPAQAATPAEPFLPPGQLPQ